MANTDESLTLHVPAREIPVPAHLSPAAQSALSNRPPAQEYPPLEDLAAWRAYVARMDDLILSILGGIAPQVPADVAESSADGAHVYVSTPRDLADDGNVYLDIHGGALIAGGGELCGMLGGSMAVRLGARVWSVDYRMPPDHPYPAPLDDCIAAYGTLLRTYDPGRIIVGGGSAGGNLAAAMILRARDEGLPLPAAAILVSPEADLTESGDSFKTNLGVDPMGSLMPANLLYAAGHDLRHPYISPVFGDFIKGFPPTLITTGTRDLFLSNAVRLHRALRAAGIPAELHVLEAAPHMRFPGSPEEQELQREIRRFADRHWQRQDHKE